MKIHQLFLQQSSYNLAKITAPVKRRCCIYGKEKYLGINS